MTNLHSTVLLILALIFQIQTHAQAPELLKDIAPGAASSNPINFAELDGKVFFFADDRSPAGLELWRSDGTDTGTEMLGDLNSSTDNVPGGGFSQPFSKLVKLGNELYFLSIENNAPGTTGDYKRSLFKVGSTGNPMLVKANDIEFFGQTELTVFNGNLYWIQSQNEIWKSDGTPAGTTKFHETADRILESLNELKAIGGELFFTQSIRGINSFFDNKIDIWKTDGTTSGTQFYKRAVGNPPIDCGGYGVQMFEFNGQLAYTLDGNSMCSYESWLFVEGFDPITVNHAPISGLGIFGATLKDGKLFYLTQRFGAGFVENSLTVNDGVQTEILKSFKSSFGAGLLPLDNGDLLIAGTENLWVTDGTTAGTKEIRNFENGLSPKQFIKYNDGYIFSASEETFSSDFWFTDGTVGGTQLLASFGASNQVSPNQIVDAVALFGNTLYLDGENGFDGEEVYKFDLSQAPTPPVCTNNLFTNPGFEDGMTGWSFNRNDVEVASDANSGNSAARLLQGSHRIYQFVAAEPNKKYTLRGKAKTTDFVNTYMKFLTADWQPTGRGMSQRIYGNYSPFEQEFTAPSDVAWIEVSFWASDDDDVLLDDLCLSVENPDIGLCSDNLIINGGFEDNMNGYMYGWERINSGGLASTPFVNSGARAAIVCNDFDPSNPNPNPQFIDYWIEQSFSVEAGAEYELRFFVLSQTDELCGFISFFDADGNPTDANDPEMACEPFNTTNIFIKKSYSEIAPPNSVVGKVRFMVTPNTGNQNCGYVDDVCVRKIADPQTEPNLEILNIACPQTFPRHGRMTFDFTVKNTGTAASVEKEIYIRKALSGRFASPGAVGMTTVPALQPNEEVNLTITGFGNGSIPGTYYSSSSSVPLMAGGFFFTFDNGQYPVSVASAQDYYCRKTSTDLEVEVVPVTTEYDVSGEIVFKVIAKNNGPDTAYNTVVNMLSNVQTFGVINFPPLVLTDRGFEWFPDKLAPGESVELQHILQLSSLIQFTTIPDEFEIDATISSGHNIDTNPTNNTDAFLFKKNTNNTGDEDNLTLTVVGTTMLPAWQNGTAYFEVTNRGGRTVNNIKIDFVLDQNVRLVGGNEYSASAGATLNNFWTQNPTATIPSIGPGGLAHVQLNLFSLTSDEIKVYGQISEASGNDPTSTPGNGTPPVPNEDDEDVLIINGGSTPLQADLTINNLAIQNTFIEPGEILNYTVDLSNVGNAAVPGNFTVKSYISTDPNLSNDDIQDGELTTGNFGINFTAEDVLAASTIPTGLADGTYFLILKIDADEVVAESNENNNTVFATFQVDGGITNPTPDCPGNLLTNPGFENGLTGWEVEGPNSGSADIIPDPNSGLNALQLSDVGAYGRKQTLTPEPDATYKLTFYGKKTGTATTSVVLNGEPIGGIAFTVDPTTDFRRYSGDARMPSNASSLEVLILKSSGNGSLTVDDVCLQKITDPNDGVDLELVFGPVTTGPPPAQWSFFTRTLTIQNTGSEDATGIEVEFKKADEVVYKGGDEFTSSQGDFQYWGNEIWSVGTLAAGESATLDVNYFRISGNDFTAYAQVSAANEPDSDSTPGNGSCCILSEDDEAAIGIGSSSSNSVGNRSSIAENLDSREAFAILKARPNPVFDQFNLDVFSNENTESELVVFDILGRPVLRKAVQLSEGHNSILIDAGDLPSGFLSVKMTPNHPYLRQIRVVKMK